jgi:hypothetical protein
LILRSVRTDWDTSLKIDFIFQNQYFLPKTNNMSHSYNLRSKTLTVSPQNQIDQMNKKQLSSFMVLRLKCLENPQSQKEEDIMNLFYAATLMVEKYTSSQNFLVQVLVKLNHAITLDRFSIQEKAILADYLKRIQNNAF